MTSLKARLSWSLTLSLIGLLALQWLVVTYAIRSLTENQLVDRLQRESENLLAIADFSPAGGLILDDSRMGLMYQQPLSGHYYVILTDQAQSISRSLWDSSLQVQTLPAGQRKISKPLGPDQQPLILVLSGYRKQNHAITIAVAENIAPLQANIQRFQMLYAMITLLGSGLILLVNRQMILSALGPLQTIQQNLLQLERGETSYLQAPTLAEIAPLVTQINRLLVAMDKKYQRSRDLLGNLAHALKTRLTLLNQTADQLDVAQEPALKSAIYAETAAIHHIIDRELKRARLIGDMRPGRQVNLQQSLGELVDTLRQIYAQKGVTISWKMSADTRFMGDKEDLIELLGNLLDNACKWSRGHVLLTLTGGESTTFIIEDDGPGASLDDLDLLTRRGFRADESIPGSGLGLAIVSDIVESYHGTLAFSRSATLGGLCVTVTFNQNRAA